MQAAHELILLGGGLGLVSLFAGLVSARFGAPTLLVFLLLGMLAGEDGPGGIVFDDFNGAYLIGSIALAVILFDGGIKTDKAMLRLALWPAMALGTIGVVVTAAITGYAAMLLTGAPWQAAMLVGAALAPTDAAAVSSLLSRTKAAIPERLLAVLEVESGLNDPMSVVMTLLLVESLVGAAGLDPKHTAFMFGEEMGGGLLIGLAGGAVMLTLLRRWRTERSLYPVVALTGALTMFGGAQSIGASGFLAVYVMGVVVGTSDAEAAEVVDRFFGALTWLAQIALFLMLGLLVTPHELLPIILPTMAVAAVLILVARPVAAGLCLAPFRFKPREIAFASWVGLRGAVPIYLAIIPVLAGARNGEILFGSVFTIVVISLLIQGWTIGFAARLLGFGRLAG